MEIYVKNLGRIKEGRIKLNALTIFVGKNNTNKTWTAYLINALSSYYFIVPFTREVFTDKRYYKSKTIQRFVKLVKEFERYYLDTSKSEEEIRSSIKQFLEKEIDKELIRNFLRMYTKYLSRRFYLFISVDEYFLKNLTISLKVDEKDLNRIREFVSQYLLSLKEYKTELLTFVELFSSITRALFGKAFNLPAEREALVIFSPLITLGERNLDSLKVEVLETLTEKLREFVENLLKGRKLNQSTFIFPEVISKAISNVFSFEYDYPIPISDFKDSILRIKRFKQKKNVFNELTNILQEKILEGSIQVDKNSGAIYYVPDSTDTDKSKLNVSSSSSMVKSLSSLYLYLKYFAEEGDLLIIDEPEMNLHPEAQVKLIEFLSILANNGLRILITTHTPYIVDHVINLMEGYEKRNKEGIEQFFMLKDKRALISSKNVSVYLFDDDGVVKDILDRKERFIDWKTFSDISDYIENIYSEITSYGED